MYCSGDIHTLRLCECKTVGIIILVRKEIDRGYYQFYDA